MKLRLRSMESHETLRIVVPVPCSLPDLKNILIQTLSSSPSSSSSSSLSFSASSLRFSLNCKDELQGSSDTLYSLGITSGDLVFYTFNPSLFSSQKPSPIHASQCLPFPVVTNSGGNCEFEKPKIEYSQTLGSESVGANMISDSGEEVLDSDTDSDEMDTDDESIDVMMENKRFDSKPMFLRRVLKEKLGYDRNAHKLLVTSVHAVLLESGFVPVDPDFGNEDHLFRLPDDWPSPSFTMSLWYTLPELIVKGGTRLAVTGSVLLKFQSLGHYVNVYGSLDRGSFVYRVSLDGKEFAPILDLIWASSDSSYLMDKTEEYPERQVFEFWKVVKDKLVLPLLIDLCEKSGLPPPASFMCLPADLKLKIFKALPGVDIGKLECVCTELRFLASSNDLWKLKADQEFGCKEVTQKNGHWKASYVSCVVNNKLSIRENRILRGGPNIRRIHQQPVFPHIVRFDPVHGLHPPFRRRGQGRAPHHVLHCDLGRT